MTRTSILSASLLVMTAGCGGTVAASGGAGGSSSASGSGSGTQATGSSSASTSSGATGSSVTLTLDTFTVPAGSEVYKCQNFANPWKGMDAEVSAFESHMTKGSHHVLLFYKPGATDGPLEDCSGLEFAATPYGSQLPDDSLAFPAGVAALVSGADGMRIQSHYLNVTSSPITAHVEVTLHVAAPGSVQQQAGVLFVVDPKFAVPPHSKVVVVDDCTVPIDMNLIKIGSHMHRHGTDFVATAAGSPLYQTSNWSDPSPALFNPAKVYKAGDPLHFACTFDNTMGATTLTFGESALTNEMCILSGSFYPTPAGQATITASNCKETQQ